MPPLLISTDSFWRRTALIAAAALLLLGCNRSAEFPRATFSRAIPWAEQGVWLKADTHLHTRFSDGGVALAEVVRRADQNGCKVIALTDHADADRGATSEDYFLALEKARKAYPHMAILSGLEWNVPPWRGREHAAVIVPPGVHERKLLRDFQALFDDYQRDGRDPSLASSALYWLKEHSYGIGGLPVVFYNHPSRKREASRDFVAELAGWKSEREIAVGFEGGPGHQDSQPIGGYQESLPTIDRWDPVVARIGDAWDELLKEDTPVWGALATSDFHSGDPLKSDDYWPGEFSETWLYAANATPQAALDALRSGAFFGAHGHIVRNVQLKVSTADLPRAALPGEAIRVAPGTTVRVSLEMLVPDNDWRGNANAIDEVELIAVTRGGAKSIYRQKPSDKGPAFEVVLEVPAGGITFRARGRRSLPDKPDLMFYTNPVQAWTYGTSGGPAPTAPVNVALASAPLQIAVEATRPVGGHMPSFMLLALIGCGSVLIALADLWRVEAARRFAGSKANSPPPHTKPYGSIRIPLAALVVLTAVVVIGSVKSLQFAPLEFSEALGRLWDALRQPVDFKATSNWLLTAVPFFGIGALATAIALGRHASDRRRIASLPLVVGGCMLLSAAGQMLQIYAGATGMWQNHVLAQSLAALLGGGCWTILAPLFHRKTQKRSTARGAR
jgi:hypothetical protein